MAAKKSRKPAITGMARPQGIIDDVVYPIVSRALRSNPIKKATKGASRSAAKAVENRQVASWGRKTERALDKSITREEAGLKPKRRIEKKWRSNAAKKSAVEDYNELYAGSAKNPKSRNSRVRRYAKMEKARVNRELGRRRVRSDG